MDADLVFEGGGVKGIGLAAAYSVLPIGLVFGAIGVMSVVAGRTFRTAEGVDMALGVG